MYKFFTKRNTGERKILLGEHSSASKVLENWVEIKYQKLGVILCPHFYHFNKKNWNILPKIGRGSDSSIPNTKYPHFDGITSNVPTPSIKNIPEALWSNTYLEHICTRTQVN